MARPPKGKPLTLRPIRLDDDVWAECQRLGKVHGTINEGLAAAHKALRIREDHEHTLAATDGLSTVASPKAGKTFKRGPRPKGDRQR